MMLVPSVRVGAKNLSRIKMQHKYFVRNINADRVYFNYKRAPYLLSKWPLFAIAVVEVGVLAAELIINQTAYLQVLTIPLILNCLNRILKHKEDLDKATESIIVKEQLAGVNPDGVETKVIAKEYFIVSPKEAYLTEKRFLLVVLSDGKVYRYRVESAEKNGFVLDKNASLCEDEDELVLVKKYTDKINKDKSLLKVKRKAGIAAAGVLFFGVVFIGLVICLGRITAWMKTVVFGVFAVLILSMLLLMLSSSDKKGFVGMVYRVSSWVFSGLWLLIQLLFPTLLLVVGFLIIILAPFSLIFLALQAASYVVAINTSTVLFISLSMSAIISSYYSKSLFGWLSRVLKANGHKYEKYLQEMVEYVYQPSNLQFVVYFLYVVYLTISTIHQLQTEESPLFGKDWDLAVLGSFLVYIAFSNMKTKRVGTAFNFSELFRMMWGMWTTHDNVNEGKDRGV